MKKISILMCLLMVGLFAVQRDFVDLPPDHEGNTGQSLPFNGYRQSPGIQVGETDYDFQNNGSLGRYTVVAPSGGVHFYWTYSYDSTSANRRAYYNYHFPPSYWLGPTGMDTDQSRMGSLGQMPDGRGVASAHSNVTGGYASNAYVDAAEGAGTFTINQMPDPGSASTPIWPKITVDQNGHIYCAATVNGGTHSFWTKSTDEGATWLPWDSTLAGVPLNLTTNYLQSGRETWAASHASNWTSLVNSTGALDAKVYWETDGSAWYYDTIWVNSPTDSVTVWFWSSAVYDNDFWLHVVFDVQDTASTGGGAQQSGWRSQIWHWDQQTGVISPVDNGMGWYFTNPGPGYNHGTVSEPQIAIDRATGDLYCTWTYADSADVAANGYINEDIWGARSTDNGVTWFGHVNITNSPSPGATIGNCDADRWQTLAEETDGSTIHLFYMNDKQPGSAAFGDVTGWTMNPMLYYAYSFGVEENKTEAPRMITLNVRPNPSRQNTAISYALSFADNVSVKLYSVDGRLVQNVYNGLREAGVYTENLNASQLANGTYFVVLETGDQQVSKSLVVVR